MTVKSTNNPTQPPSQLSQGAEQKLRHSPSQKNLPTITAMHDVEKTLGYIINLFVYALFNLTIIAQSRNNATLLFNIYALPL